MNEIFGIYPAIVCDIKDPEKRGRIRVSCPDIFGDIETSSAWCDPCVPYGIEDGGDICIPDIDEGVWIMFNGGDIDSPVYLGGWWSEGRTPFQDKYPENPNSVRIMNFKDVTAVVTESAYTFVVGGEESKCNVAIGGNKGKCNIKIGESSGEVNIEVGSNVKINIDGNKVQIKSKKVIIEGDVEVKGKVQTTEDAIVQGKSYLSHTHSGVHGETAPPS